MQPMATAQNEKTRTPFRSKKRKKKNKIYNFKRFQKCGILCDDIWHTPLDIEFNIEHDISMKMKP